MGRIMRTIWTFKELMLYRNRITASHLGHWWTTAENARTAFVKLGSCPRSFAKGDENALAMNHQTRPQPLPVCRESMRIQVIVSAFALRDRRLIRLPRERIT